MTYSFIDAAVIALRLKQAKESGLNQGQGLRSRQNRVKKILLQWSPWAFFIISFMSALSLGLNWQKDLKILFGVLMVINFGVLLYLIFMVESEKKAQDIF